MKKYMIVNDNDGNDSFEIEAKDVNEAAHEALNELGWWVAKDEEDDEPKKKNKKARK